MPFIVALQNGSYLQQARFARDKSGACYISQQVCRDLATRFKTRIEALRAVWRTPFELADKRFAKVIRADEDLTAFCNNL